MTKQIVVVDCETTGLDPDRHAVVEVAWWNLSTDEHGTFIPPHRWVDIAPVADPVALRINGYLERVHAQPQDANWAEARRLGEALYEQRMAGSNPSFDHAFLTRLYGPNFESAGDFAPHHRLLDLSAFAAGVLRIPPGEMPGLAKVCDLLQVDPPDHSAAGDVRATGECFKALMEQCEVAW